MNDKVGNDDRSRDSGSAEETRKKKVDWSDPSVPVGNAPSLPAWPAAVCAIAWVVWVVFLLVMALTGNADGGL